MQLPLRAPVRCGCLFGHSGGGKLRAYEPSCRLRKSGGPQRMARRGARIATFPRRYTSRRRAPGCSPIIIFSHGLGGSRDSYEYLGRHWAGCGYVSRASPARRERRRRVERSRTLERLRATAHSVGESRERREPPERRELAIDRLIAADRRSASPRKGRLDPKRIGVAATRRGLYDDGDRGTGLLARGLFHPRGKAGQATRPRTEPVLAHAGLSWCDLHCGPERTAIAISLAFSRPVRASSRIPSPAPRTAR